MIDEGIKNISKIALINLEKKWLPEINTISID
jgi:hypothetical protein